MKTAVPGSILILLAAVCSAMAVSEPNGSCGCPAKSEVKSSGFSAGKLLNCNEIMKGFENGENSVKVIVNLAEPVKTKAKTDWHSKRSLKLLHDEIKTIQTPVLSSLSENEFKLRYCFDNQAGFSGEVTLQGLEKLKNDARVISIEPVYLLEPHLRQGIPLMHADTHRSSYNGAGTAIAICDTGIDYRHPMLGNGGFPNSKVIGGYDYGDNDADPMPDSSQAHGTCCAGIAAGDLGDVGDYIGGVAYNAKLYALKITAGSSGSATSDAMVAAWDWCVTHQNDDPAHPILAISTSFGGGRNYSTCDSSNPSMTQAANDAVAAGITVLASSGNDGYCDSIAWPACISSVISVGAVYDAAFGTYLPCISGSSCATKYSGGCSTGYYASDNTAADMVTSYSNTASFLTVLAPSNQCYTTDIIGSGGYSSGDYYSAFGGTSAACPYAAGTVACLQSAAKTIRGSYLSPSEVRTILTSTGDNVTDGKVAITKPRINLQRAINNLLIDTPPTANSINVTTLLNTSLTIALQATDDGRPNPPGDLSYIITSLPSHGSLSDPGAGGITAVPYTVASNGNQVIYTPTTGYSGTDNFTFKANDGGVPPYGGDSNQANVSVSIVAIFLTEGFESPFVSGAPTGWSKAFLKNTVDWIRNSGDYRNDGSHGGVYNALLYASNRSSHETYLITPAINFASGTQEATLEFWHKQAEWLGDQDTLTVYYKTSAGGSWTLLASYTTDVPSWTQRTISLPNPSSNYYIGFLGNAKYGYGVCIDDVKVTGIVASLQRTLSISSTAGGHTEPNEGDHQFSNGTVVDINAVPDVSCHFVNWTGTGVIAGKVANPNSVSTTITMDSNYTVTANFAIDTFTLNYSAGTGGSLTGETTQVVDYNTNGTAVTAVPDTGYHFVNWSDDSTANPRTDLNVTANIAVTANFVINQMTISGYITEPDANISVAGVFIDANNGDSSDITDSNGYYELWVNYDWSGTVIPTKDGYNFEPNGIFYNNVVTNEVNDYTATLSTFAIAGYVLDFDGITPISDVNVSAENGGGQWTSRYGGGFDKTDVNGYYKVVVDYNWSGAVTPTKYAYAFDEPNIVYTNILADQNGQDYTGRLLTFTISGYVRNDCNNIPIKGVTASANNGGNSVITDANGYYEVWVDYNWSGKVTVSKAYYTFIPSDVNYIDVLSDQLNQNYQAANIYDLDCNGSIGFGDLAIMCENWLMMGQDIPGDFYKDDNNIVNFMDFANFALIWQNP